MIGMVTKSIFFDTAKVAKAVSNSTRKVLSKFGAFVRTTARHSIRKRKAVSQPGQPPSSHVGLLKKLIYFGYDKLRRSVVIGPTALHGAEAPPLLEYGGRTRVKSRTRLRQGYAGQEGRNVMATYRPRPFMGPAFEREKPKLPAMWANSIR
mgnify:CR=1 FL=1